jgi:hypothetical protein
MSLTFIANATGLHRQQIKRELDTLINTKVIIAIEGAGFNSARTLSFNKHYDEWQLVDCKLKRLQVAKTLTVNEKDYCNENSLLTVSELDYTHEQSKNVEKSLEASNDNDSKGVYTKTLTVNEKYCNENTYYIAIDTP